MTQLALLRDLYRDESLIERLTAAAPPVTASTVEKHGTHHDYYKVNDTMEPGDQVGRSMSAGLLSLLGQITHSHDPAHCEDCRRNPLLNEQRTSYSPRFPVRKALTDFEKQCRRYHRPPQWRDHFKGPVCSIMLRLVVEGNASIAWAAEQVQLDFPRAERLVLTGAEYCHKWVTHWDHDSQRIPYDPDCPVCRPYVVRSRSDVDKGSRVTAA